MIMAVDEPDDLVENKVAAAACGVSLGQIDNRVRRGILRQYSRVDPKAGQIDRIVWLVSRGACKKAFKRKDGSMPSLSESERDLLDKMPIGANEILFVGDVRYGVQLLREAKGDMEVAEKLIRAKSGAGERFLAWSRSDVIAAMEALREVKSLVDVVVNEIGQDYFVFLHQAPIVL